MKLADIMRTIEEDFPKSLAVDWDNVGLLVGDEEAEIRKVLINLDVTDAAVERAVKEGADLILTHHPLLFRPLKTVTEQDFIAARVRKLIRNDINYYAMHTNFDIAGMADQNAVDLSLREPEVLEELGTYEDGRAYGLGRIGLLPEEMTLKELAGHVKDVMKLDAVRVYGDPERKVLRVGVSSGAGKSAVNDALRKHADVLITGDLDYHTAIDADARGLAMIDAGHYGTEFTYISFMEKYVKEKFPELDVLTMQIVQPYHIV
ncbi:MAG TPA: Nif3-like dinuclear metal center hexameric protein [Lachnospiraceae bacterium]|nr:Nif3-like dinuclear metal center hexameric protein [Lachnospiraceae bacterium]